MLVAHTTVRNKHSESLAFCTFACYASPNSIKKRVIICMNRKFAWVILALFVIGLGGSAMLWKYRKQVVRPAAAAYTATTLRSQAESNAATGYTLPVPSAYNLTSTHPGSVVSVEYDSYDYAGNGNAVVKTAYVYLPYSYDETDTETKYDIIYLMHGWGGEAGRYLLGEGAVIKNTLDHMIENGEVKPVIAVSPSFYNENTGTDFSSSVSAFRVFYREFENDLMPAVEGRFCTYAEGTSQEELAASRDHRAFGGFSLGSVTTWLQFCENSKYIRYFLPMSGSCWYYGGYGDFRIEQNADHLEEVIRDNDLEGKGYFIYFAVGTNDSVKGQSLDFADELLSRTDTFSPEHFVFYQKEGGYHDRNAAQEFIYNALPLFFGGSAAQGSGERTDVTVEEYFNINTRISDVMTDEAFGEYGRLIFPVNDGYYSGSTLGNLSLTWYSHIDPNKTVEIANYMKSHALAGDTIFYDIYTEEEKAADPSKRDTGLFFFKGNPGARFAICNAGGGMVYVGAMHDSFPHALELSKLGYNAFALIYRPGGQTACEDLARAISFIFEHADELKIDTSCYSLWGGSAGARMAAWLGSYGTAAFGEADYPQAGAVIMQYTGLSEVTGNEPPTYNCVGTSDGIASYRTMENRITRIAANGTDTEIEVFSGLPHGFGLGTGTVAEGWINNAVAFWERQMNNE